MSKLPLPIRRVLRDPVSDRDVERVWHQIATRRASAQTSFLRRSIRWSVAGACVVGLAFAGWYAANPDGMHRIVGAGQVQLGPLRRTDGTVLGAISVPPKPASAETIRLLDGSRIWVSPGTRALTTKNDSKAVHIRLLEGALEFTIAERERRRWVVTCGPLHLEGLGVHFLLENASHACMVIVKKGAVHAYGKGMKEERLRSGVVLRVSE